MRSKYRWDNLTKRLQKKQEKLITSLIPFGWTVSSVEIHLSWCNCSNNTISLFYVSSLAL